MQQIMNALIWSALLTGSVSFASSQRKNISEVPSVLTEKKLMEELTGNKSSSGLTSSTQNLKSVSLSERHFLAGKKEIQQKNYILAIKHFNTIIKNYPQSKQVEPALLAKAQVYQEMGLQVQAERNRGLAQLKQGKSAKRNDQQEAKIRTH